MLQSVGMFTTECPRCGRELDVSEVECPNCTSTDQPTSQTKTPPTRIPKKPTLPRPVPSQESPTPPVLKRRLKRTTRKMLGVNTSTLAWLLIAFLLGVISPAIYHTADKWFEPSKLVLEDVSEKTTAKITAISGDLEVAGLRTWWDLETETIRVRAVVINHGKISHQGDYKVSLYSVDSDSSTEAVAFFSLLLTKALAPRESRDVETQLMSLAHPSALPVWTEQRIKLEKLKPAR